MKINAKVGGVRSIQRGVVQPSANGALAIPINKINAEKSEARFWVSPNVDWFTNIEVRPNYTLSLNSLSFDVDYNALEVNGVVMSEADAKGDGTDEN